MASRQNRSPEDVAAKAGGLLMRLGLAVLMIALPLAAIYSRRLVFTLMPVGAGLIFAGAALVPGNRVLADIRRALATPVAIAAVALCLWIAISLLWTPFVKAAFEQLAKCLGTIGLAFVVIAALPGRSRISNLNLMPIGAGISAVAAAAMVLVAPGIIPNSGDLELSTLERAAVGLVLLVWPALAALGIRERWAWGGALAVAVTSAAVAVWTPAAMTGMAAGALVFSLSTANPRRMSWILAAFFALLLLGAPALLILADHWLATFPGVPSSLAQPVAALADLVRESPGRLLTGFGYNTLGRATAGGLLPVNIPTTLALEVWFELGALGAVLVAAVVAGSFVAAGRIEGNGAAFLLAGETCILVIAFWGLATLQLWWITLLGATAISFGIVLKGQMREERPGVGAIRTAPQPAV